MDPLERYKGHDLLLEALVPFRNHDWSWLVVGEGGDRLRLEELVRHWGLESRVRFSGLLSDADLREAYSNCSLLAMPSAYELLPDGRATGEGFGIAYLEAACMGRPSLACTLGGQTDLIVEGQTGWLVEPTVSALQRVLQQILDNPQELASRGAAARFRAVNDFGAARFNKQIAVLMERSS
jgi:glycosyltransferase involved in cell wall biosynthesis